MQPKRRYRARFGLWHGQDFSNHDVQTSGVDDQAALRRAIRGVIRTKQPQADKEAVRNQLRGALSTIGRHYSIIKVESQTVRYYHGTSQKYEKSIRTHGLRKGSFVALEKFVARGFAGSMFPDEKSVVLTISLPANLISTYLDTEVESTAEVVQTIPPQFIQITTRTESQTRHFLSEIACIPSPKVYLVSSER